MTLKELSQLYYLRREIEMDLRRLEALRAEASSPGSPVFDGMPKSPSYENRLERYTAEIVDLEAIISAKITLCRHERNCLERYIADIPDSNLRMIFTLRFVEGLSWVRLAFRIGGNCTADGARMACNRYIRKTNGRGD